ncbi:MAG: type II toxin-antitoxin system HicB family antitoxin [Thiocapsa sp.]|jgi:predicted RNase H-like HicB family nuclease|uniref:type II toxin-antitoxin system HicB family antitoxin n=1 Tax=Thiocapsa sp. TaxID=2024551 RepID=UPI001BCCC969|nr:type II toxin-antitoxin system HicB family antitoxin [Thiocapsa sp.]QVL48704.1 MAG: type II toxin-antitoxin system HicB family antitoxin [Thiocapsa sp.]
MTKYLIEVFWSDEDQGFIAIAPDLPGCSAFGDTAAEAVRELEDAQSAWIEACQSSGDSIPAPTAKARHAA